MSTEPAYNHAFARVAMGLGYVTSDQVKRALYERRRGDRRPLWLALADSGAIAYDNLELIERKVKNLEDPCPACRTMRYRYTVETPIEQPCPVCHPEAAPEKPFAHHERERQRKLRRQARKAGADPQASAQAMPSARISSRTRKPDFPRPAQKQPPGLGQEPLKVQPRASTRRLARPSWTPSAADASSDKNTPRAATPVSWTSIPGMGSVSDRDDRAEKTALVPAEPLSVAPRRAITRRSQRPKKLPKNALPSFGKQDAAKEKQVKEFVPVYHPGTEPIRRRKRSIFYWLACLLAIGLAGYVVAIIREQIDAQTPDIVLAPHGPSLDDPTRFTRWAVDDYQLLPLRSYSLKALVVGVQPYADRDSKLAPVDLAVTWGPMSNPRTLKSVELIQENRSLRAEELPFSASQFYDHSQNLAIIPANSAIEEFLQDYVRVGKLVEMSGLLVDVEHPDHVWRSGDGPGETRILWLNACRFSD